MLICCALLNSCFAATSFQPAKDLGELTQRLEAIRNTAQTHAQLAGLPDRSKAIYEKQAEIASLIEKIATEAPLEQSNDLLELLELTDAELKHANLKDSDQATRKSDALITLQRETDLLAGAISSDSYNENAQIKPLLKTMAGNSYAKWGALSNYPVAVIDYDEPYPEKNSQLRQQLIRHVYDATTASKKALSKHTSPKVHAFIENIQKEIGKAVVRTLAGPTIDTYGTFLPLDRKNNYRFEIPSIPDEKEGIIQNIADNTRILELLSAEGPGGLSEALMKRFCSLQQKAGLEKFAPEYELLRTRLASDANVSDVGAKQLADNSLKNAQERLQDLISYGRIQGLNRVKLTEEALLLKNTLDFLKQESVSEGQFVTADPSSSTKLSADYFDALAAAADTTGAKLKFMLCQLQGEEEVNQESLAYTEKMLAALNKKLRSLANSTNEQASINKLLVFSDKEFPTRTWYVENPKEVAQFKQERAYARLKGTIIGASVPFLLTTSTALPTYFALKHKIRKSASLRHVTRPLKTKVLEGARLRHTAAVAA
jgi:hypothetical protein